MIRVIQLRPTPNNVIPIIIRDTILYMILPFLLMLIPKNTIKIPAIINGKKFVNDKLIVLAQQ